MSHQHSVTDSDKPFAIDEAMKISSVGEVKALKRGDHKSERYSFTMPRHIEGHDMSLCNKVEVHFNNVHYDKVTRETTTNSSFAEVEDFQVSAEDENAVTWSWLIENDATQLDGTLNFCFRFACTNDDGSNEYQKFTDVFEGVPVGVSIYNAEKIVKECADVVQKWMNDIEAKLDATVNTRLEKMDAILEYFVFTNEVTV